MTRWLMLFLVLGWCAASQAQAPQRVRGELAAIAGDSLTVRSAGGSVAVQLTGKTQLLFMQPIRIEDIRPGDFLAITSRRLADGTLAAYEVRRMPKPVSPGHRPFDGREDQTMTNATVEASVESASARELSVAYEGGAQKIVVPPTAFLAMLVPGERSQLVAGSIVSIAVARGADARLTALQVQFRAP